MLPRQKIPAPLLARLADSPSDASRLEAVVRPLLDLLEEVTGLDSTYFTVVDEAKGIQTVVYAKNTRELQIPEGLCVPWEDTLCQRAILEERRYTNDVAGHWGDSDAAQNLGICTYLSEPIRLVNDTLYGTLCAASDKPQDVSAAAQRYLTLFSSLIARYIESEKLLDILVSENSILTHHAYTDPLTGIPNRLALVRELHEQLQSAQHTGAQYHVAFIDLDGFKDINDEFGHDAGDRFLIHIARCLVSDFSSTGTLARYGGDEFVLIRPATADDLAAQRSELKEQVEAVTQGAYEVGGETIYYAGASVGVITTEPGQVDVDAVLQLSDSAMYERKRARKEEGDASS